MLIVSQEGGYLWKLWKPLMANSSCVSGYLCAAGFEQWILFSQVKHDQTVVKEKIFIPLQNKPDLKTLVLTAGLFPQLFSCK